MNPWTEDLQEGPAQSWRFLYSVNICCLPSSSDGGPGWSLCFAHNGRDSSVLLWLRGCKASRIYSLLSRGESKELCLCSREAYICCPSKHLIKLQRRVDSGVCVLYSGCCSIFPGSNELYLPLCGPYLQQALIPTGPVPFTSCPSSSSSSGSPLVQVPFSCCSTRSKLLLRDMFPRS